MSTEREARREARRRAAHRRAESDAPPAGATSLRSKPVRITVDLTPETYRQLTRWTVETAVELDRAKLPLAEVVRALIRLTADSQIETRLRDELRSS